VRSAAGLVVRLGRPPGGRPLGPSAWAVRQGPSAGGRPTRTFVRTQGHPDAPGRRPSDVIFPKDVRCDNPGHGAFPASSVLESITKKDGDQGSGGGGTHCRIASATSAAFSGLTLAFSAALTFTFFAPSSRRLLNLVSSSYRRNLKYSTTSILGLALGIVNRFKAAWSCRT
jgi:hypothetical protein